MSGQHAGGFRAGGRPPIGPRMGGVRGVAIAVVAFGVAFGYLEAAVVVYLRAAIGAGTVLPTATGDAYTAYQSVEVLREAATLAMIATVGWLAGRSGLERLAWAAVVFGTWDITYYAGLHWAIGWPSTLEDWDVLFLIPGPWVGPVWAPIVVSLALVVVGLLAGVRFRGGGRVAVGRVEAIAGLSGGLLVIGSFLLDAPRVLAGDANPWMGWPLFWIGMALAATAAFRSLRRGRLPEAIPSPGSLAPFG